MAKTTSESASTRVARVTNTVSGIALSRNLGNVCTYSYIGVSARISACPSFRQLVNVQFCDNRGIGDDRPVARTLAAFDFHSALDDA